MLGLSARLRRGRFGQKPQEMGGNCLAGQYLSEGLEVEESLESLGKVC